MVLPASHVVTADEYNGLSTGVVGTYVHGGTHAVGVTTTETAVASITTTLDPTHTYIIFASFNTGATNTDTTSQIRVRYRAGATIGTPSTATQAHGITQSCLTANKGVPVAFMVPMGPAFSGQYTFALTIIRSVGTGSVQIDDQSDGTDQTFVVFDQGA